MKITAILFFTFSSICFSQTFWELTNGPNELEYITSIYADSTGKVYVGIEGGGLYRSVDTGKSFIYIGGILSNTTISTILVDKHGHIFAGDGDYTSLKGVLKSTDDGNTWIQVIPSQYIQAMTIDTDGNIYAGTRENGIFRSTDDGNNWINLDLKSTVKIVTSIAANLNGDIFASGWITDWYSGTMTICSIDKGETWNPVAVPFNCIVSNFAFAPDSHIVAAFRPALIGASTGIMISDDNGASWETQNIRNFYPSSLIYDKHGSALFAAVPDSDFVWVNINKSTDFGMTWSTVYKNIDNPTFPHYLYSNQVGYIFEGYPEGLQRSSDGGLNWLQSNVGFFAKPYDGMISNRLTLFPGNQIYIGIENTVYKLAENKVHWLKDSVLTGSFLVSNTGNYFVSNNKVYKSTDNGRSWMTSYEPPSYTYTSEITKLSNGYIFAGAITSAPIHVGNYAMIYRSIDDGTKWTQVYSNNSSNLLTITSTPDDILLASGDTNGVVRSTDFGNTWLQSINGLPANITCKVIRTRADGMVFMGTASNGMFRSSDAGLTWSEINSGLNSLSIRSIAINSNGAVFVATANGVFYSNSNGDNWFPLNDGLLDLSVLSILCDSSDYIYAATSSAGVYRSMGPVSEVEETRSISSNTYSLYQNYPNPFNPFTVISYRLPVSGYAELKVYDILGKVVAVLVNEEKPAGAYNVVFNGSSLSSGVYFYRLQAGSLIETKKLILMK